MKAEQSPQISQAIEPLEDFGFSLEGIDPSLFFMDDDLSSNEAVSFAPNPDVITFSEWLETSSIPTDEPEAENFSETSTLSAFTWADQAAVTTSTALSGITFEGLNAIGGSLGSLLSVIGACGPLCLHAAGALAQSGASLGSVTSLGGVGLPGFNIDGSGKYTLSGDIKALSSATGLSSRDLMSGKYSSDEIMERYFKFFGLFSGFNLVGGFIHLLFDAFTPQVKG